MLRNARCRIQRPRTTAEFNRAGALIGRPNIGAAAAQAQRPASTFTVPLLLNSVLIVEVVALPVFSKIPRLFTTAVAPVSALPRLTTLIDNPLLVV